jgi:hypothetical protein
MYDSIYQIANRSTQSQAQPKRNPDRLTSAMSMENKDKSYGYQGYDYKKSSSILKQAKSSPRVIYMRNMEDSRYKGQRITQEQVALDQIFGQLIQKYN